MSTDPKYQAGHAYGDAPVQTKANFFDDPVRVATSIIQDYIGARCEASLPELIGLIKSLLNKGEPADDRKGNTELLIGILTSLPSSSATRTHLTHKLIDSLWSDLQHPPLTYVGCGVKYEVASSQDLGIDENHSKYDVIEFEVPDTGIRLREEVPRAPNGLHNYRMPDGSSNNILEPDLGRAGSPYAKSVKASKRLHGVRPDAGQLFDLLMARGENDFKENPAGISSMLFYHATIIIHDVFRTSRTDMNKSDTSSYLDLAPLYGSSLRDQLKVRTMKEGKLKPDTFHEKRLLGQPAGVNVMLVLYNRFHNYVADVLLKINEGGRFTLACQSEASPENRAKALAKQDHDIFNTARLIVVGLYVSISLGDYLRGIMNTHCTNTDWALDPRTEIGKQYDGEGVPRGVGNQVSVEFNLLYRFHACISKRDERWINEFFLKLFPGRNVDDLENVTLPELGQAMLRFEKSIPVEPSERTFDGLERQANGRFKDKDLVRTLKEAMEDPAGIFGAKMVPKALKIIEIQGINQARKWGCASLNEFREFFGLKRYTKFKDINSDDYIAHILEKLYTDPDMVEMYPGMMIEDAKPVRNPGVGVCPTYTVGRAVLADAVTLVRSDRFLTLDYSVSNMTAWGMNEVQPDSKTLGGSMLYKLIQRGLPGWFPFNSVAVMQPMYTKKANIEIAKKLGTLDQYTLDDPAPPKRPVVITTWAGLKQVLENPKQFPSGWNKVLDFVFYRMRSMDWFMAAGDEPKNYEHRQNMNKAFQVFPDLSKTLYEFMDRVGNELISKETFELKKDLYQLDIIRDVAIPLNTQLLADTFYFDLRTDENPTGVLGVAELYKVLMDLRIWGGHNTDPAQSWNRRRRAEEGARRVIETTRKLVDEVVVSRGLGFGFSAALSQRFGRQSTFKKNSLRSYGHKLVEALLAQGNSPENVTDQLYLMAFGGLGVVVTSFYEVMEYLLRPENSEIWSQVQDLAAKGDVKMLQNYVAEAQRLTNTQSNVRYPAQPSEVEGKSVKPGDVLVLRIADAGRDPEMVPNADKFDPHREQPEITGYSTGPHICWGIMIAVTYVTGLVKLVADLKNLRPAPGASGMVRSLQVGFDKVYLNDSWSYLTHHVTNWRIQFDGHGKGTFQGNNTPQDAISMQEYYDMLKTKKEG